MEENIFGQCGTTYDDVHRVVKRIAQQLSNMYDVWDYYDELVSYGMLTALECLRHYDKTRNAKPTTYLYRFIFGRLKSLAYTQKQYVLSHCSAETQKQDLMTDSSRDVPVFLDPNPYRQRPDVIYDARREQRVIQKVCEKHESDIEMYRCVANHDGGTVARSRVMRQKKRCAAKIRQTLDRIFILKRPLSAISSILDSMALNEGDDVQTDENLLESQL